MRTIPQVCIEAGDQYLTNEHLFRWLSEVLADDGVSVRSEFPASVNENGTYTVTVTARAVM